MAPFAVPLLRQKRYLEDTAGTASFVPNLVIMNNLLSLTARRLVAPAVVASALVQTSRTRAEKQESDDDPYANLPEEDEETTCFMCLVNRQGPCRDYWRKFERCLKDHPIKKDEQQDEESHDESAKEETADASVFCDQYMLPWLACVQSYRNLYLLYFNYLNQTDLIEPLEESIRGEEIVEWKEVNVDWSPYVDWVKSKDYTTWDLFEILKRNALPITPRPEYEGEDPEMVEIEVKVKLQNEELPLQIAYAKDQGGLLLGMEHFSEKEEKPEETTFKISFRPSMTANVQFYAFYKNDKDEVRLLSSQPIHLIKEAAESGEIPEGTIQI